MCHISELSGMLVSKFNTWKLIVSSVANLLREGDGIKKLVSSWGTDIVLTYSAYYLDLLGLHSYTISYKYNYFFVIKFSE